MTSVDIEPFDAWYTTNGIPCTLAANHSTKNLLLSTSLEWLMIQIGSLDSSMILLIESFNL
eukprot:04660.XXX_166722_166904_1 [CDS] Oithona nana genome sequencing.